jgi:hypothetical protein
MGSLPTVNAVLGPMAGAVLVLFDAVPAAREILSVPDPLIFDIVTVRVVVPVPLTLTVPLAVLVRLSVMWPALNVTAWALVYVTVYDTGPVAVAALEGAERLRFTPGAEVFVTVQLLLGPALGAT